MIIWIYIGLIIIQGEPLTAAGDMKYAFTSEATCKKMIEGLPKMKCIPLELMK